MFCAVDAELMCYLEGRRYERDAGRQTAAMLVPPLRSGGPTPVPIPPITPLKRKRAAGGWMYDHAIIGVIMWRPCCPDVSGVNLAISPSVGLEALIRTLPPS